MPSLKVFLGAGLIALLVNTGYISAFATPSIFYMMMVLAHLVLGLALAIGFVRLLMKEPEFRRGLGLAGLFFAISIVFALYLLAVGNLRAHQWALRAHIVTAIVGVVALIPFVVRSFRAAPRQRAFGLGYT